MLSANLMLPFADMISILVGKNVALLQGKKIRSLYTKIVEAIRKSLNIDKTKKLIVEIVGEELKADRCFIAEYDKKTDKFLVVKDEYISSADVPSYLGGDVNKDVPNFSQALKKGEPLLIDSGKVYLDGHHHSFIAESETIEKYKVHSAYAIPIFYQKDFLGVLSVHYIHPHVIADDEINLMTMISDQVAIALRQSYMYDRLKKITANQDAILNNMPFMAWLKDTKSRLLAVNEEFAKMCNTSVDNVIGKTDFDFFPPEHAQNYVDEDNFVMKMKHAIYSEDLIRGPNGERWHETFKSPVLDEDGQVIGTVGLARDITERKESELVILGTQEKIFKQNKQEASLREIFETMRSSLDLNIIKRTIVDKVGKAMDADVCFILSYNDQNDIFSVDENSEYKKSQNQKSYINADSRDPKFKWFIDVFRKHQEANFPNLEDFLEENNLIGSLEEKFLREYLIKSAYNISIYYMGNLMGYLILQYTSDYRKLEDDDIKFLRTIAAQAGTAFHQAKLYNRTILDAQREKFSRTIVEILRSSMDKNSVKKRFVQIIGNFFKADRVLLSEYDPKSGMYLPLNFYSQFLSSPKEVSFVDYDWGCDEAKEYVQRLLSKRELIIPCWSDYIRQNIHGEDFVTLFVRSNVKSSYNFPILYQEQMMGFFCIEFTQGHCQILKEDEISLMRNIAAQAGIALYHANLYEQAKESASSKEDFINNISYEVSNILDKIVDVSKYIAEDTCNEKKHSNCIMNINQNLVQILNLKNNIENIAKIESDSFKLNYEAIELRDFLLNVIKTLNDQYINKKIQIILSPTDLWIRADYYSLNQFFHNLFFVVSSLIEYSVEIQINTSQDASKIFIEIVISGASLSRDEQNNIFELMKQIDTSYSITRKGVGLSLLVSKKIIELHRGSITVKSSDDKGTIITIELPQG